jgi:hypothetical protein
VNIEAVTEAVTEAVIEAVIADAAHIMGVGAEQ